MGWGPRIDPNAPRYFRNDPLRNRQFRHIKSVTASKSFCETRQRYLVIVVRAGTVPMPIRESLQRASRNQSGSQAALHTLRFCGLTVSRTCAHGPMLAKRIVGNETITLALRG
jgi:hypothetical protein